MSEYKDSSPEWDDQGWPLKPETPKHEPYNGSAMRPVTIGRAAAAAAFAAIVIATNGPKIIDRGHEAVADEFYEQFGAPDKCLNGTDYENAQTTVEGVFEKGESQLHLTAPGDSDEVVGTWNFKHHFSLTDKTHFDFTPADAETQKFEDMYGCPPPHDELPKR
jgi:hypothetical protein